MNTNAQLDRLGLTVSAFSADSAAILSFQSVNQSAGRSLSLGILEASILPNTSLLFDPCSSDVAKV